MLCQGKDCQSVAKFQVGRIKLCANHCPMKYRNGYHLVEGRVRAPRLATHDRDTFSEEGDDCDFRTPRGSDISELSDIPSVITTCERLDVEESQANWDSEGAKSDAHQSQSEKVDVTVSSTGQLANEVVRNKIPQGLGLETKVALFFVVILLAYLLVRAGMS